MNEPPIPVAIVGVGVRVREAADGAALLRLLAAPTSTVAASPLPPDRWDAASFGPPPRARVLDETPLDFRAFRLPPVEVARMHRMERAVLAAMHAALVDAGLGAPGPWGERTAVYVGATTLGADPAIDHQPR